MAAASSFSASHLNLNHRASSRLLFGGTVSRTKEAQNLRLHNTVDIENVMVSLTQENTRLRTIAGQAKVMGTLVCAGGALLLSLCHGPIIPISESYIHLTIASEMHKSNDTNHGNLIGPCLIIFSAFSWAIWFVLQNFRCIAHCGRAWGKSREVESISQIGIIKTPPDEVPLQPRF
ncbi:Drug/metabolite transporter [Artemisia annua]|uniref:Drug/metabolite transporter n=1 Tax=Artemisia annua TaxID=35608 RepID=A0A2U1MDE9_ARTAN|nr:Drug/metabolite transporter [Artemisia annua]